MGRKNLTTEEAVKMAEGRWSKVSKKKRKLHSITMNTARWDKYRLLKIKE